MYNPPMFREDRPERLWDAIRAYPLGTLVTAGAQGMTVSVLPFRLVQGAKGMALHAHLARKNGQLADLAAGAQTLAIFQGPQAYVSPSWYATKRQHGRVVPTWNYLVVEVRGTPIVHDDPQWVRAQITVLTDQHEAGRAEPWQVSDAPPDYIAAQIRGIVGLELPIAQVEGKWKVSQNQPAPNRDGVARGMLADGDAAMAELVRSWRPDDDDTR